jgi:hypothetical protein
MRELLFIKKFLSASLYALKAGLKGIVKASEALEFLASKYVEQK